MKKIKVSVLVPVYNVKEYLEQCLESLAKQTLKDIEFICINDGSTDGSEEILARFVQKDKRFSVISKKNTGYGDSMNRGLAVARGEYIGIVEPDDFIETEAFARMVESAEGNKAEIVRAEYYEISQEGRIKTEFFKGMRKGVVLTQKSKTALFGKPPAIWSGIYRRDFLEKFGIRFLTTPGASYQDTGFYFKTLAAAERVVLMGEAFLNYRVDNAKSSVKNSGKIFEVMKEHESIREFLEEYNFVEKYGRAVEVAKFANYCWNIKRLPRAKALEFAGKMREEFLRDREAGLVVREDFPRKYWVALRVLFVSAGGFVGVVKAF